MGLPISLSQDFHKGDSNIREDGAAFFIRIDTDPVAVGKTYSYGILVSIYKKSNIQMKWE